MSATDEGSTPTPQSKADAPPRVLLDVRQAAAHLSLSKSTLDKMRCFGKGPAFIRLTARAVRYDVRDLDAWVEARRSEAAAGSEKL